MVATYFFLIKTYFMFLFIYFVGFFSFYGICFLFLNLGFFKPEGFGLDSLQLKKSPSIKRKSISAMILFLLGFVFCFYYKISYMDSIKIFLENHLGEFLSFYIILIPNTVFLPLYGTLPFCGISFICYKLNLGHKFKILKVFQNWPIFTLFIVSFFCFIPYAFFSFFK